MAKQKISPCLWFDGQAEDAAAFYVSVFPNSRVTDTIRMPGGGVALVRFELDGVQFQALNGGPEFKFNEAVSLSIDCRSQAEVDELWEKLSAGGSPGQCGWLKDRYGVSWQVIPAALPALLFDGDPAKCGRVFEAIHKMSRIDMPTLEAAAAGR